MPRDNFTFLEYRGDGAEIPGARAMRLAWRTSRLSPDHSEVIRLRQAIFFICSFYILYMYRAWYRQDNSGGLWWLAQANGSRYLNTVSLWRNELQGSLAERTSTPVSMAWLPRQNGGGCQDGRMRLESGRGQLAAMPGCKAGRFRPLSAGR